MFFPVSVYLEHDNNKLNRSEKIGFASSVEFFRIDFCRIYRICRMQYLGILKIKTTNYSILQILKILYNTNYSNYENDNDI